jgi:SAM-dependent methyltransferase
MKNPHKWRPSKYEISEKGVKGTHNSNELAVSSRLIADLTAAFYNRAIPAYARGKLLDMGCGKAPLYGLYKHYCTDIILTDWDNTLHQNEHLDFTCDLNKPLPVDNNEFNTILLSDVLEHIVEPMPLWKEMHRILSPRGKVILNTPFMYWLHEQPYDYYRFTEHALKHMAESAGFRIIELDSYGGGPAVILDILAKSTATRKKGGRFMQWCIGQFSNRLKKGAFMKKSRKLFPLGYFMVVEKLEDSKNNE